MSYTGNKWTSDEISKAVELFKKGKDYASISDKLDGRTAFAVQCKLEYYVYDKINSNTSYETLAKDFKRSESDLKKMYESQQNRNPQKTNTNSYSSNSVNTSSITASAINFTPSPNNTYGIINRVLTPYIEYHSNLEKLEKLKRGEIDPEEDTTTDSTSQDGTSDSLSTSNFEPGEFFVHPNAESIKINYGPKAVKLNSPAELLLKSIFAQANTPNLKVTSTLRTYDDQARVNKQNSRIFSNIYLYIY